jgi:vacuolar iron transporter family protein
MKKRTQRKYLPEFIYGAIDGTITTFAIVAGAMGASLSASIILILGFANLFADGFSMAISNYLSTKSEKDLYKKHNHIHHFKDPKKTALATFSAFVIVGFIPLLSFVLAIFFPTINANKFTYSIILTALAFIIIGYYKGNITKKSKTKSSLETLIIGSVAALIAFVIGHFLRGLVS